MLKRAPLEGGVLLASSLQRCPKEIAGEGTGSGARSPVAALFRAFLMDSKEQEERDWRFFGKRRISYEKDS